MILDQCVVSAGTFMTGLLAARILPPRQYGQYAVILTIYYFFYSAHAALVVYPVTIVVSSARTLRYRQFLSTALSVTALAFFVEGGIVLLILATMGGAQLTLVATAAMVASQLQETTRRALVSHFQYRACLLGDVISYLGQAFVVGLIASAHIGTLSSILATMFVTSAVALIVQSFQLHISPPVFLRGLAHMRFMWGVGRWSFLGFLFNYPGVQGCPWLVSCLYGETAMAYLQAARNPLGVTHPLLLGVANLIVPTINRMKAELCSTRSALVEGARHISIGAAMMLSYCVLVFMYPGLVLHLTYGANSAYTHITLFVRLIAASYFLNYLCIVGVEALNGLRQQRIASLIQSVSTAGFFVATVPLGIYYGVAGTLVGVVITLFVKLSLAISVLSYLSVRDTNANIVASFSTSIRKPSLEAY
jgi:O-antigen/teichoic acid export membrane protein